jgi:hypothetical protein
MLVVPAEVSERVTIVASAEELQEELQKAGSELVVLEVGPGSAGPTLCIPALHMGVVHQASVTQETGSRAHSAAGVALLPVADLK